MDTDLRSIYEARTLLQKALEAQQAYKEFSQDAVDEIVKAMALSGAKAAEMLANLAHEETGFGRVESKVQKNLFATRTLLERMQGMKTCGVIRKLENDSIWEIATPMGIVAALVPSTNPTSTAMYKAILAAKARCGLVISPHPRAKSSTAEALRVVAEAAYRAGAPEGLFGCMTEVTVDGTNALLEDPRTDLILATGGSAMVRAAYSKGKPAYGVGSGNVPAYVDRSADLLKASLDLIYGASFDYGTLCSTERSIVADLPIRTKLVRHLRDGGAHFLSDAERDLLRVYIWRDGRLNVDQVGKSPAVIARSAGFSVATDASVLIAEVNSVGPEEPLSAETLSPILSFYTVDGWKEGCERCKEILAFGGIGHTLGLHSTNERIVEAFALEKPAMRIVVNTVCALGAVGYTNRLFPAMTLGPGTIGGSITSDNISPLHLINVKRLAFETDPIHEHTAVSKETSKEVKTQPSNSTKKPVVVPASEHKFGSRPGHRTQAAPESPWMAEIDARLRARAGNPPSDRQKARFDAAVENAEDASKTSSSRRSVSPKTAENPPIIKKNGSSELSEFRIRELIRQFRRK